MKHIIYIVGVILLGMANVSAQSVADVWQKLPRDLHTTIDSVARLDMIDLYRAGMTATAPTLMGDTAQLIALSDNYLLLRTSKASTMQIKLIKLKKKTIYAIITTVEGPAPNSHIDLYNEEWETISHKKYIKLPTVNDFISVDNPSADIRQEIGKSIVIPTIQYMMNDSTNDITALPSFMQTLDKESRERIMPHIQSSIKLHWNGKKWK